MSSSFSEMISYLKPLLSESDYNRLNHDLNLRETSWNSQNDIHYHRIATLEGLNLAMSKELKDYSVERGELLLSNSDLEQKVTELNSELGTLRGKLNYDYELQLAELKKEVQILNKQCLNWSEENRDLKEEIGKLEVRAKETANTVLEDEMVEIEQTGAELLSGNNDGRLYIEENESQLLHKEEESVDNLFNIYNEYAFRHGFGITKSNLHRSSKDKRLTSVKFACCKEGKKNDGKEIEHETSQEKEKRNKRYKRHDTKTGCKAHIFLKPTESGKWVVTRHEMEHNHEFLNLKETTMLKSHRHVSKESVEEILRMMDIGIKMIDAYNIIKMQTGGEDVIGFTEKDAYNAIARRKREIWTCDGDAQELIHRFGQIKKRDKTDKGGVRA